MTKQELSKALRVIVQFNLLAILTLSYMGGLYLICEYLDEHVHPGVAVFFGVFVLLNTLVALMTWAHIMDERGDDE